MPSGSTSSARLTNAVTISLIWMCQRVTTGGTTRYDTVGFSTTRSLQVGHLFASLNQSTRHCSSTTRSSPRHRGQYRIAEDMSATQVKWLIQQLCTNTTTQALLQLAHKLLQRGDHLPLISIPLRVLKRAHPSARSQGQYLILVINFFA